MLEILFGIIFFIGYIGGMLNAGMDTSRDGKKTSWLFNKKWFLDWNIHYNKKEKKRSRWMWGLINIPNDAWHHMKFSLIISIVLAMSFSAWIGYVIGVSDVAWYWAVMGIIGSSLLWYAGRISGFSTWYECFFWKKPADGIKNYFKKRSQK